MRRLILAAILSSSMGFAEAVTVQVSYALDTGFFSGNDAAKEAVEKAAADLSAVLANSMGAVTTNTFTGVNGNASLTLDWSLYFNNPANPLQEIEVSNFTGLFPANTIRIFVGATTLSGQLGVGGPATAGYGIDGESGGSSFGPALVSAANKSNAALTRGSGPVIGSFPESEDGANVTLSFGAIAGKLSLESNIDWHFDIHTAPAPGTFDLYTVALHEMIHAIGFGTGVSWFDNVDGTDWLGENVIALLGSGVDVLSLGEDHIKSGTESPRISDGVLQLAIMDPGLAAGTRKELTELDLAFLRDIGYLTVPEPGTIALAAMALLALGGLRLARGRA